MSQELWPWKCSNCQRINKKTAVECALCRSHWSSGTRHRTQPQQQTYSDHAWEVWEADDAAWNRQRLNPDPNRGHSAEKSHEGKRRKEQSQGQKDQEWRRKESTSGQTTAISFCATSGGNATMAIARGGNGQPAAGFANCTDWSSKPGGGSHAQKCVLREQPDAARCERVHRKIRERDCQDGHKDAAFSYHSNGQGAEDPCRNSGGKEAAQGSLDCTYHGGHQNMAIPIAGLPQATEYSTRGCEQSQSRHRAVQNQHSAADHHCTRSLIGSHAFDAYGSRSGRCQSGSGQCGREVADAIAIGSQILCRVIRSRVADCTRRIGCDGRSHQRRRGGKRAETTAIVRALWGITAHWFASGQQDVVNAGGVFPVHSNGLHDAIATASLADAYVVLPEPQCSMPPFADHTRLRSSPPLATFHPMGIQFSEHFCCSFRCLEKSLAVSL